MAIHLIIDGYNVIGRTEGLGSDLLARRRRLIERLSHYRQIRGHAITVVFDGTHAGGLMEESMRASGIDIIYSRVGQTADELMRRMVELEGAGCVVVSSDRAVQAVARNHGAVALSVGEFETRLREAATTREIEEGEENEGDNRRSSSKRGNPRRLSKTERRKRAKLRRV